MKLIVAGSRKFSNYILLKTKLDLYLSKERAKGTEITVISGKASGADTFGEKYAKENNFKIEEFPANWDDLDHPKARIKINKYGKKYNAHAGHLRNEEMAKVGTHLVAFIDLSLPCSGTRNMVSLADKYKLFVKVVYYQTGNLLFDKIPRHT